MKLTADRPALAAALRTVTRALPRNPHHQVLNGVHLTVEDGVLRLQCSDLDLTITTTIDVTVDEPGAVILPARAFGRVLGHTDQVTIIGGDEITITAGRVTATLPTLNVDEWPLLPVADATPIILGPDQLDLLGRLTPLASTDHGHPSLTGVNFNGDKISVTDSYRAALATWGADLPAVNVPATGIAAVLASVNRDDTIEMRAAVGHVTFDDGTTSWTIRNLAYEAPNVAGVLRDRSEHHISFDVDTMLEAIAAVTVLDPTTPIRIQVDAGVAELCATTTEMGTVTTTVDVDGDIPFPFGFNGAYLASALKVPGVDRVTFGMDTNLKPGQIDDDTLTVAFMPSKLGEA